MKESTNLLACMEVFIQVAECRSFSAAARALGISQSSVSRQIGMLETTLGVRLLQRTTRHLSLTEAGEIYYKKSRLIKREVIEAGNAIAGFQEKPSGTLKIGAPIGWTEIKIAPYLAEFMAANPEIDLDIIATDDLQDVVEERLDLVLRVARPQDSSYVVQSLGKIKLVLCATPEYLRQQGVPKTPADLLQHNCIVFDHHFSWSFNAAEGEQALDQQILTVSGRVNTNMVAVMISMTLQHMGITLLPVQLLRQQVASGELVEIFNQYTIRYTDIDVTDVYVLYANRKHLPTKIRAFIDFFRDKI